MRKYWYYTFFSQTKTGQRVCYTDSGEFDLYETTKNLDKVNNERCIITFWNEISVNQYQNMKEYFENREF